MDNVATIVDRPILLPREAFMPVAEFMQRL